MTDPRPAQLICLNCDHGFSEDDVDIYTTPAHQDAYQNWMPAEHEAECPYCGECLEFSCEDGMMYDPDTHEIVEDDND